ncbi:diguanylate cyclase [Cupriavidus agavae]|uniref:Diguanylate cyclase n=1 Tax=Cupriavidus agavae TaxID=1001822 RepID=A0A4Q7RG28_9BURK|nr:diguanylate cyclase [Cupriavidus agavae]RZT31368.1 hypothetical protein EV147_4549 [Cupriavidus agavae]
MQEAVRTILMYGVIPVWILAGLGDWWSHRRTQIERNAGLAESAMHSLMMAQVGIPVLLALFFEINALLLAAMVAGIAVHAVTAWIDVRYASRFREIVPFEQHMHSLLEVLPITAFLLVASVHWDQLLALFGGAGEPDYRLRLKEEPLPASYLAGLMATLLVFVVAPYAEELLRCARARPAWRRQKA